MWPLGHNKKGNHRFMMRVREIRILGMYGLDVRRYDTREVIRVVIEITGRKLLQ